MVGYAVYKKNTPGPLEVVVYKDALDESRLDALSEELHVKYRFADLLIRLMPPAEFERYLTDNPSPTVFE